MRLLIACPKCGRQYDASGKRLGSRFRCHCGEAVVVREPKGHGAKAVRCSSCGAPQEEGSTCCRFCGADFTLHERDLNTVCPRCMARISDRAKFCHHCGNRIAAESVVGEKTRLACPACGKPHTMSGRRVADVPVLECGRCAGLWLGDEAFKEVTDRAANHAINVDDTTAPRQASPENLAESAGQRQRYRKCPLCGEVMNRRNYARRSGVILDVCGRHGIWFDAEELPRIIHWIRAGGLARANRDVADEAAHRKELEKVEKRAERRAAWADTEAYDEQHGLGNVLAEALVEAVFAFFGR